MEGGLFLDVVVGQGTAVFELLPGKDETSLIRRNTLFVLNLGFHIFDFQGDSPAREGVGEGPGVKMIKVFFSSAFSVFRQRSESDAR